MPLDPKTTALIRQRLDEAERNIQYALRALEGEDTSTAAGLHGGGVTPVPAEVERAGERVIEGVFDGQNMQGNDGEEYPVPPNYASKSKLVEGDVLKLTIGADGSFIYKQIGPVERRREVGTLVVDTHGNFGVKVGERLYKVLLASVTFYKAEESDELTILLPKNAEAQWGAVEYVIHQHP